MTRRLARLAALSLALVACGCGREAPSAAPAPAPSAPAPAAAPSTPSSSAALPSLGAATAEGVRYLERVTGGAAPSDTLPLLIAIHGLGDRPESFAQLFDGFPARARLIVPYGEPYGNGFSWFPILSRIDPEVLAPGIERAAARLALMIKALASGRPTAGKPIVTGFSQGGMLSFALAALHPEAIGEAYPVSGFLPSALMPPTRPSGKAAPPIVAFHGDADRVVAASADRQGVARLKELGLSAELRVYPGVEHTVSAEMRRDIYAALAAAVQRATAPER